ncbi:MAG: FKBP-type peptidyl-prolyl cis-trans isomerase [Coxiellaceae bacterium]|nr:FKBP-type peptidyl-prolyl cis-trans isomerase [Coxiellaceae bacterium]
MKLVKVVAIATVVATVSMTAQAAATMKLTNKTDKTSYAMGLETGMALKSHQAKINPAAFSQGLTDGINGNKPLMTKAEVTSTLRAFQQESIKKMQKKMGELAKVNMKAGQKYLAANKAKSGVVTLPNGLQYKVLTPGKGAKPKAKDKVTVNYEGKLIGGKVFDSSYKRGKPAQFPVSGVIPGWTQALQMMKTGATWMVYIPPNLAYGVRGVPGVIGPNQTLIFKVNLVKINS